MGYHKRRTFGIENIPCKRIAQSLLCVGVLALVYFPWFFYLEATVEPTYWLYMPLDDRIPFLPSFIVFYLLWFPFMIGFVGYFLIVSQDIFEPLALFLGSGMLICLLIYTLFPNGQALRPEISPEDGLFAQQVARLYLQDTPTNVCPSIHAYNTVGVQIALVRAPSLRNKWWVQIPGHTLAVLIILSTVMLKQHSVVDMFAAFALAALLYPVAWRRLPRIRKRSLKR